MDIPIEKELRDICEEIVNSNFNAEQWAEIESDDIFQSGNYSGGFDADENEFCFSYFASNKIEYWFQFDIKKAKEISNGNKPILSGRVAE